MVMYKEQRFGMVEVERTGNKASFEENRSGPGWDLEAVDGSDVHILQEGAAAKQRYVSQLKTGQECE